MHCLQGESFARLLPSISLLDDEQIALISEMCDIYGKFEMPQFLQGENLPCALLELQNQLREVNVNTFRPYLFSQVCLMCGLSGHEQTSGSAFMTSAKAVPVLIGILHMQHINEFHASEVYFSYVMTRATYVGQVGAGNEARAFARLICLMRIVDPQELKPLEEAWRCLSLDEKEILADHFNRDGIVAIGIVILYLPAYLSNASENEAVGTLRGLRILVELLQLLYTRLINVGGDSRTLTVDIQSVAEFTHRVHSSQAFEQCLDYLRMRNVGEKILVVIDEEQGSGDMREQVAQIQRTIKQLVVGQSKIDSFITNFVDKSLQDQDMIGRRQVSTAVDMEGRRSYASIGGRRSYASCNLSYHAAYRGHTRRVLADTDLANIHAAMTAVKSQSHEQPDQVRERFMV